MPRSVSMSALVIAVGGALGMAAISEAQTRNPALQRPQRQLPACSEVEAGALCRDREGNTIRRPEEFNGGDVGFARGRAQVRGEAEEFGGADVGFAQPEVGDEVLTGFVEGDPDRPVVNGRVMNGEAPRPMAMDCEDCDDDEDLPQDTSPPRGGTGTTTRRVPSDPDPDPEDCEWNNPPEGPDQEECDE